MPGVVFLCRAGAECSGEQLLSLQSPEFPVKEILFLRKTLGNIKKSF
jgi:hypothetical protein